MSISAVPSSPGDVPHEPPIVHDADADRVGRFQFDREFFAEFQLLGERLWRTSILRALVVGFYFEDRSALRLNDAVFVDGHDAQFLITVSQERGIEFEFVARFCTATLSIRSRKARNDGCFPRVVFLPWGVSVRSPLTVSPL